ncbi:MAG: hypothetical protein EAZ65_01645 [Verrucomicrobia bacterium]|nr:MAG: hypothetical protein EAZ84_05180 [Verrucomicrobiota bacterium]TAE89098.1 MAG: hypothetical protein EAZ82_00255 [Verrucomicrobiota bacterium]TAF28029.1 MAG: hypothetical protein EAZ71_01650 [Verrucomicrobiota bacterium]TAF42876.1 MAG: hypothetical protein EAZ65_01645 [Verrucomicrobiota bacterium]
MKSSSRSSLQIRALLAATLVIAGSADAVDYTVGVGETLNLSNGSYTGANLLLQGGTVSGSGNYNAYGASVITGVAVSGSAPSTITGSSWFNIADPTTFTVADVTGSSATDLLVNTSLRALPGNPDYTYSAARIIKEGAGTMEVTVHSYFRGGLDLNGGTLKLSGGNGGYGFFDGAVTVNSGTTLSITSDGSGLGYQGGWRPSSVNINGGMVTDTGGSHIWGISGGVNMTGGTLQGSGFQWNHTNLNTNPSADTATIAGQLNLRGDGGYTSLSANVANGAAATDLLISGNITETYGPLGLSKSGAGTMELSGANSSYTGATTVSGGKLVVNGSIATSATIVQSGATLGGAGTVGTVTIQNNGVFAPGNSPGTMTLTGNLVLDAGSVSDFEVNSFNSGNFDLAVAAASGTQSVQFNGTLNLLFQSGFNTMGSLKIFDFDSYSGSFSSVVPTGLASGYTATFDNSTGTLTVVPEPASALMGGLGLLCLLRRRRA